ncbi:hypothetical protein EXIGLDRAFT_760796 [Exidia glandulosa HHB12029]|uniref:MYND-type domain-containing protein n=1 Tax=Exidia glandulosa HHB12029 TaxID=1314781 RepID=A0A165P3K3_EXIGL|nr:hypothetical protein EXIGLDRAFT_760796 [Exidia glandulosa HHB12029]
MSVSSKEELNQLPAAPSICFECMRDSEDDSLKLLRCTTCKNEFYCSVACQRKAWKQHKHNCSLLPIKELEYPEVLDATKAQEMASEVQRVADVLYKWELASQAKRDDKDFDPAEMNENEDILNLKLQPPYDQASYTRLPSGHQTHKYRTNIMLISRFLTIQFMTPSPSRTVEAIDAVQRSFADLAMPRGADYAQVWGPKIACRPGDLSPGEYALLASIWNIMTVDEWSVGSAEPGGERQFATVEEKAFAMRFVNLGLMYNALWDVE